MAAKVDSGHPVSWKGAFPCVESENVLLRPIKKGDLPFYQELFQNAVAMSKYADGKPRDITARFQVWWSRWMDDEDPFSALAVVDKKINAVFGHVLLGHGDYDPMSPAEGFSEVAIILDPKSWDKGFGTEIIRNVVAYAKELFAKKQRVPSEVTAEQWEHLPWFLNRHLNVNGEVDWVGLDFTTVIATCRMDNEASYKIFKRVFVGENGGTCTPHPTDLTRHLFKIILSG